MSTPESVLAVITARGGSKGLPRKNTKALAGLPLIAWTVHAALKARCISRVVVSTDDKEIASAALAAGAEIPFIRPARLASDTATSIEVMRHALRELPGYRRAVLLQPTSPLRSAADLDAGFKLWEANPTSGSCVSVCQATESPWLMYSQNEAGALKKILASTSNQVRRQDMPKALVLNGAFYFLDVTRFETENKLIFSDSIGHEMPVGRSIDIDTQEDFDAAERQLQREMKQS